VGHHDRVSAMGVPRDELPKWEDIQVLTAQLHKVPLLDDAPVGTEVIIGPNANKPLVLKRPLFVSDMSFGVLSEEAKVALATGAELAGTVFVPVKVACCRVNKPPIPVTCTNWHPRASVFQRIRYKNVRHFISSAVEVLKSGTGGHLPGSKVKGKITEVRGLAEGGPAISPSRLPDWEHLDDYRRFAAEVRESTGGILIGVKPSAQHIERDIEAALQIGVITLSIH